MNDNPLAQYFRTPAIHLELPSKGEFYEAGSLEMPESGEIPILPMTAVDEITYKTPDALFNGSAVADVIQSCVPAIKNAWQMPVTDLTAVLCAIRIASFGHIMDLETKCPKCGNVSDYEIDLREVLESIQPSDYSEIIPVGDLKVKFKPMTYRDLNDNNKLQFEEQKLRQLLTTEEIEIDPEDQIRILSETFKKVSEYTVKTLSKNIEKIITPQCSVTEQEHILEFLQKCNSTTFKKIKSAVIERKNNEMLKPLHIKCTADIEDEPADGDKPAKTHKCNHEYDQNFTLDMTSFFVQSSSS